MIELYQDEKHANYLRLLGWEVIGKKGRYVYVKKVGFYRYVKIQRPAKTPKYEELKKILAQFKGIIKVSIEPRTELGIAELLGFGFKRSKLSSLPTKTIIIDLQNSEKYLLSAMHHKTRYNIFLSKRKGVVISTSDDFNKFAEFWQKSAYKRKMFLSHVKLINILGQAFGKNAFILEAVINKKVIASVFLVRSECVIYYMYAATSKVGSKNHAPSLLVWESIKLGKKLGCKFFDFAGIYDSRVPLNEWKGFSRFKKSFGGQEQKYPVPIEKIFIQF